MNVKTMNMMIGVKNMKVSKLIELLKSENQDSEIMVYLGCETGWEVVKIGVGDAVIGQAKTNKSNFVLIPIKVPKTLQPWAKDSKNKSIVN